MNFISQAVILLTSSCNYLNLPITSALTGTKYPPKMVIVAVVVVIDIIIIINNNNNIVINIIIQPARNFV
jgi:hypothetical protein